LAIFGTIQGNLVNFTLQKKTLPEMEMSKMLQNGSKFSILFVGEISQVSLVIIPLYVLAWLLSRSVKALWDKAIVLNNWV
jgi:hypothetical protein